MKTTNVPMSVLNAASKQLAEERAALAADREALEADRASWRAEHLAAMETATRMVRDADEYLGVVASQRDQAMDLVREAATALGVQKAQLDELRGIMSSTLRLQEADLAKRASSLG